jgi:phosphatidylglycerophosphate synthase
VSTISDNAPAAPCVGPGIARRHPISRWYVQPAAEWLAAALRPTRIRPVHLTLCGLVFGSLAAAVLVSRPELAPVSAALVLGAWFFDRADGALARRQNTVSAWGAWLDANVDELLDVGLHVAVAAAAASQTASSTPWLLLVGFVGGKYLFVHGLATEQQAAGERAELSEEPAAAEPASPLSRLLRGAYHMPGNADVRVHLLAAALATGLFCAELWIVAVYYNVRWLARYALVARRLGGRG